MDIDFVVLWVDGSDAAWQAEKARYQGRTLDDSNAPNRFRDWGLMPSPNHSAVNGPSPTQVE